VDDTNGGGTNDGDTNDGDTNGEGNDMAGNKDGRSDGFVAEIVLGLITVLVALVTLVAAYFIQRATKNPWWYVVPAGVAVAVVVMAIRIMGYGLMGWGSVDPEGLPIDPCGPGRLDQRLYRECDAMAQYALSSGFPVPDSVLVTLGDLATRYSVPVLATRSRWGRSKAAVVTEPRLPDPDGEVYKRLGQMHAQLAQLVAPATPRSLRLIREGSYNRVLTFLGRVRLARLMTYLAIVLVAAFVVFAMKGSFSEKNAVGKALIGSNLLFGATGSTKIFNALELVAAAGLGAVFYALYKVNGYVIKGTYDPTYEPTYWTRFMMGIIAGVLLALVIPLQGGLAKPFLALLGGFSAQAVYKILIRFVEALEALIHGPEAEKPEDVRTEVAKVQVEAAKVQVEVAKAQADAARAEAAKATAALVVAAQGPDANGPDANGAVVNGGDATVKAKKASPKR
jgi:hypothetical protein